MHAFKTFLHGDFYFPGSVRNDSAALDRLVQNAKTFQFLFAMFRLTIRPGLAGTVPVLRPCLEVTAGLSKCPGFLYRTEDYLLIGKETFAARVKTCFFFLFEIT